MAFEFIAETLLQRQQQNLLRERITIDHCDSTAVMVDGSPYVNFSSNDYLGLAQSQELRRAWAYAILKYGAGSGASPLVTGYTRAHRELEDYIAVHTGRDSVLLFNSGFAANQAICQALMSSGGVIVADKLSHASIIDGALSSDGKLSRFRHNDMIHLEQILGKLEGDRLLVTEGVFSMDGDCAHLKPISEIAQQHNAWLMIDDAHGLGVIGEQGLGSVEQSELGQDQVQVLMATFGKAVGTAGAFVAGSSQLIEYLVNFAKHYVYSTSMPAAQASTTLASLKLIKQQQWRRQHLLRNIEYFRLLAQNYDIELLDSDTAIQPVLIGNSAKAISVCEQVKQTGFWVTAIRPPTVPKGTDRLRVTLTAMHTENEIKQLIEALSGAIHNGQ